MMGTTTQQLSRDGRIVSNQIRGVKSIPVVGQRFDLPSFTELTIWEGPNNIDYTFTDASINRITKISSSSSSDIGTQISIPGLDENWLEITQIISLNGQNKVDLITPLIRINPRPFALTDLIGDVYIYEDGPITFGIPNDLTTVKGYITAENNIMHSAIYSVPVNHVAFPLKVEVGASPTAVCCLSYKLIARPFNGSRIVGQIIPIVADGTTYVTSEPKFVFPFQEKTDIEIRVESTTPGSSVTALSAIEQIRV